MLQDGRGPYKKSHTNNMALGYDDGRRGHFMPQGYRDEDEPVHYNRQHHDIAPTQPGRGQMHQQRQNQPQV